MAGAVPTTFAAKFAAGGDSIGGRLDDFYAPFLTQVAEGPDSETLFNRVVDMSPDVPKVLLALVGWTTGAGRDVVRVVALHGMCAFRCSPVRTTRWDGMILAFQGDVRPGHHIKMVEFPEDALDECPPHAVRSLVDMNTAEAALPAGDDWLDSVTTATAGVTEVVVRKMVPVPPQYVPLVLDRELTPRQAWVQLGGAIINDGNQDSMRPVMDWLRAAFTGVTDPSGTDTLPGHFYDTATNINALTLDDELARHQWETLKAQLPGLDPATGSTETGAATIGNVLRAQMELSEANRQAEARAAKADKLPSEVFREVAPRWWLLSAATDDATLPPIYHSFARLKEKDRRFAFQNQAQARTHEPDCIGIHQAPLITPDVVSMVMSGQVYPSINEVNDLKKGIHPFTCGFQPGLDQAVEVMVHQYDSVQRGQVSMTAAEHLQFQGKSITIPKTAGQCAYMLKATSVVLDIIQGPDHPHAVVYRNWIRSDWESIVATLEHPSVVETHGNLFPLICRHVQVLMGVYLRNVVQGHRGVPTPPTYSEITGFVELHQFGRLSSLPQQYLTPVNRDSVGGGVPPRVPAEDGGGRGPGAVVRNSAHRTEEWMSKFRSSSTSLRDLQDHAPNSGNVDERNRPIPVCLSYHLRGTCYDNCKRAITHGALPARQRTAMSQMVNTYCQTEAVAPAPAPAPAAT